MADVALLALQDSLLGRRHRPPAPFQHPVLHRKLIMYMMTIKQFLTPSSSEQGVDKEETWYFYFCLNQIPGPGCHHFPNSPHTHGASSDELTDSLDSTRTPPGGLWTPSPRLPTTITYGEEYEAEMSYSPMAQDSSGSYSYLSPRSGVEP